MEISDQDYGEIVLGMLNNASFPGSESEKVTALKSLSEQLKSGVKAIHETGEKAKQPLKPVN